MTGLERYLLGCAVAAATFGSVLSLMRGSFDGFNPALVGLLLAVVLGLVLQAMGRLK